MKTYGIKGNINQLIHRHDLDPNANKKLGKKKQYKKDNWNMNTRNLTLPINSILFWCGNGIVVLFFQCEVYQGQS